MMKNKQPIPRTVVKNKGTSAYTGRAPWWTEPTDVVFKAVFDTVRKYKSNWMVNYLDMIGNVQRYEDRQYCLMYGAGPYSRNVANQVLSLNVTAACIDTLTSKICKNIPTVEYITNGADFETQEKANDLQKFIYGRFRDEKVDQMLPIMFADACKMGTGIIHSRIKGDRVIYESVKPYEVLIDWNDGIYECPMDLHIVKFYNRYRILEEFPEYKDEILVCDPSSDIFNYVAFNEDVILMIESYSKYDKRHTISINNCTLLDEKWTAVNKHNDFLYPLSIMRYKHSDRNYFGIGLAEELKAIQLELNKLVRIAQRATHLLSVPKIFVPRSANVVKSHLDNDIGGIVMFDGNQPPISAAMGAVPTDLYTQIDRFYNFAFAIAGLSQLSATSQKPAGLDSGKSLETYYQIESDRFQTTGQAYEDAVVQLNDITLSLMRVLSEKGAVLKSTYYTPDLQKTIDWDDVDLERDQYDIQVFPISMLPNTPEGKFSFVQEMLQAGMIDPVYAKKLLKLPDTEGYLDLQNAEVDFVLCQISRMIRGEAQEPDINQNFDLAQDLVQKAYFLYKNKNLDPRNLMLFDDYLQAIQRIQLVKTAQQQVLLQQAMQQQAQNIGAQAYGSNSDTNSTPIIDTTGATSS